MWEVVAILVFAVMFFGPCAAASMGVTQKEETED